MVAEIIGVGAALTQGDVLSENTRLIARELETCGIRTSSANTVDRAYALRVAIAKALERSDIIILMGGLGADGFTKETVCEGLGKRLVLHESSLKRIKEAYARAGRQMPQQVAKLAMQPQESVVFPGVRGVTPGCALSAGNQFILMIPEDPREFVPMFQHSVMPYLAKFSDAAAVTRTVDVFGPDEKEIQDKLGPILHSQNPSVALYAKKGEYQVRVTARATTKTEASAICGSTVKEIEKRLGEAAYGVDSSGLASDVMEALAAHRLTVGLGEACTGGMLGDMATAATGSAKTMLLSVSAYSDRIKHDALAVPEKLLKKYGSISPQVAAAMAYGAMSKGMASLGVAVTGSAGGRGEDAKKTGILYVSVCDNQNVWVKKLSLPRNTEPEIIRNTACLAAFDLLRYYIKALPGKAQGASPIKSVLSGKAPQLLESEHAKHRDGKKHGFLASIFPVKGDTAVDVIRKLILIIAVLVFIGSAWYLVNFYGSSASNRSKNESLAAQYSEALGLGNDEKIEVPSDYPKGYQKKFANLYKINEDVSGWLRIDGTQINYPVVHYLDNEFYLRRDFYGKDSKYGIPWLEAKDQLDPQSDKYVIYGHNMTDGQMFGELMNYKGAKGTKDFANPQAGIEYLRQHPIISYDDIYRDNSYKIMSVFITNAKEAYGPIFYYNAALDLSDQAKFDEFVGEITSRSYYNSDVDVKFGDKFLLLSTCSYEFGPVSDDAHVRTVVVGRRVRDGEKADGKSITYSINPNTKLPAGFVGGKATADAIKEANTESKTGLVPEEPKPSTAGSTAGSAASGASSTGTLAKTDEQAKKYADQANQAMQQAKTARDDAESYYLRAARSGTSIEDARTYAKKAVVARDLAKDAYYAVLDATDMVLEIYEQTQTKQAKAFYETANECALYAEEYFNEAQTYLNDTESEVIRKENGASSSSSSTASSKPAASSAVSSSSKASSVAASVPASKPSEPAKPSEPSKPSEPAKPSEPSKPSEPAKPSETSKPPEPAKPSESSTPPEPAKPSEAAKPPEPTPPAPENTVTTATEAAYTTREKLTIVSGGKKITGSSIDIVAGIVMNEMGTGFEEEALKAQAVAAYTYIKQQNASGLFPYLSTKKPSREILSLVEDVAGEAVYYKNNLAFTPFYGTSAGVTVSSADVWGGSYPYLVSVDSEIDAKAKNYEMTVSMTADSVAKKVKKALRVDLYDYSDDPSEWFSIESYTEGDRYVKQVRVGEKTTTGRILRENVFGLRSAAFDIDYRANKDSFTFTTYGYGHGVGMSQTGANLYAAEENWDYIDILKHYYPGTKIR